MEQNFETCLYNVVDAAKIQKDEPMKKHTTFRIGGPAAVSYTHLLRSRCIPLF